MCCDILTFSFHPSQISNLDTKLTKQKKMDKNAISSVCVCAYMLAAQIKLTFVICPYHQNGESNWFNGRTCAQYNHVLLHLVNADEINRFNASKAFQSFSYHLKK